MAYKLEGTILEVCTCNVLCPCWVGEDPDNPTCDAILAYHYDKGTINGTDVSGRTLAILGDIPGNVLQGNWKVGLFIDDGATDEQQQALVDLWSGKLGGPVAELAQLVGEVVTVERVPMIYDIQEGRGMIKVGSVAEAEMEPYRGPTGQVTTLNECLHHHPGRAGLGRQGIHLSAESLEVRPARCESSGPQRGPGQLPLRGVAPHRPGRLPLRGLACSGRASTPAATSSPLW